MKVKNQSEWQQLEQMLLADETTGKQYHEYLTFWVDTAEKLMEEHKGLYSPVEALRSAFDTTETVIGNVHVHFIGQMLVHILTFWDHGGETLAEQLTTLETKYVLSALEEFQARAQMEAEQEQSKLLKKSFETG